MTKAPCIRNLHAWINTQPPGPFTLIVTGEVETTAGNKVPILTRTDPQGINSNQLLLDLSINDTGGLGTQNVAFRDVRYQEPSGSGVFTTVAILWEGKSVEVLTVSEVS